MWLDIFILFNWQKWQFKNKLSLKLCLCSICRAKSAWLYTMCGAKSALLPSMCGANWLLTWKGAMQTLLRTWSRAMQTLLRTRSGDIVSGIPFENKNILRESTIIALLCSSAQYSVVKCNSVLCSAVQCNIVKCRRVGPGL